MCNKRKMSESEANELVNNIKKRQHKRHDKHIPKRSYFCPECKCYHTTHLSYWGKKDKIIKNYDEICEAYDGE